MEILNIEEKWLTLLIIYTLYFCVEIIRKEQFDENERTEIGILKSK